MSIRTDMINAKVAGKLQEATIEKLSEHINNFNDFSKFVDIVEDLAKEAGFTSEIKEIAGKAKNLAKNPKNIFFGLLSAGIAGAGIHSGIGYMKLRKAQNDVARNIESDDKYPDKVKVRKIYRMLAQFAPRVSSNYTFVDGVMEQLYNAPIISAPQIREIVELESKIPGPATPVPQFKDLLSAAKTVAQASTGDIGGL